MTSLADCMQVTSRKVKLNGLTVEHDAFLVHTDPRGAWLFSPAGTVLRADGSPIGHQRANGVQFFPEAAVPGAGWYVAWCWDSSPDLHPDDPWPWVSADVARLDDRPYTFVDLELDLWCSEEGVGIVDQDDLAAAVDAGQLTAEEASLAGLTANALKAELGCGFRQAFNGTGWKLLADCVAQLS